MTIQHRTQATVSLGRLADNIRNLQQRLEPGVEMIAVVKADFSYDEAQGKPPK